MQILQVLHMNGGVGETSYAQNSLLQKRAIEMTKPIREEAIIKLHKLFPTTKWLTLADLGCSSAPNTFMAIAELVRAICTARAEVDEPVSIQVMLNDLPTNDFNTLFKGLPSFTKQLKKEIGESRLGDCLFHAVPGSFFDRLFQPQSLHFVHSSYSLHWLSEVPKGLERSHKGNIFLTSESPTSVKDAYYQQFQTDFSRFLNYRWEELVKGGCMVFTLLGRSDDPSIKGSGYVYEPLALVLRQMVTEGLIIEEMLDRLNIPMYTPSPTEMEMLINKQGSFELNGLQVSKVDWEEAGGAVGLVKCMRSVLESMLSHHFGEPLMDQVFARYGLALADCMAKERNFFTNLTLSLIKN